jgi:hypothetical protein
MKKFFIIALAAVALLSTSCDGLLEEENFGNPTIEEMMQNEENIVLLVGQVYAEVKWVHDHWGYWGVSSLTSDECVCPVRVPGEHWADGGYWKRLNTHGWDSFADAFKNIWNSTISGAILCNKLINTLDTYKANMSEEVYLQYRGELEVMRSYYYYLLFDCFGRIPYLEKFEDVTEPLMEPEIVWSHLVACLERNAPNLPAVTDDTRAQNYGRVTQGMAYALLARLYLNAESYGCTASNIKFPQGCNVKINSANDFYTNAVRCCDNVINSGSYSIEANYFDNFKILNENSRENIFVIVENGSSETDMRYNGSMANKMRMIHLSLHYCHKDAWNMIEKPWNGFAARPNFIDLFDGKDVRGAGKGYGADTLGTMSDKQFAWFLGPVTDAQGNILKDENKENAYVIQEIHSLDSATWNDGARFCKYEVDKTKKYTWAENDYVLMRYADVLWMKEEAILRGGQGASGFNSPDFQKMKARAFAYEENPAAAYAAAYPDVLTLDKICDERGREFSWECIRRRDLIRFGKFDKVQYVTATEPFRRWFPIPFSVIEKAKRDENGNPIWTQNEGY